MIDKLTKNPKFQGRRGPVVLMIMDGVGYGKYSDGDAYLTAHTPFLDELTKNCPTTQLKAHGKAVGLPSDDDMGNSEVGHNAMGCGRVLAQGAKLVENSIATGSMFTGKIWKELISNAKDNNSTLHFLGLLSDGNVHSNIAHLKAMIKKAKEENITKIRIHTLLDGRDVGETSALEYVKPFEEFLEKLNNDNCDFRIASGGGRMVITMDRYGANWNMVKLGWETHVLGKGRMFTNSVEAIETYRSETGAIDQDLPPYIISDNGADPIGPIVDGDSLIFFNFRGDRSLEITAAFEEDNFDGFNRLSKPDIVYAGMMEYDGDLKVPKKYLVAPPSIDKTMGEYIATTGLRQMAISETQKYGHVTYFFNGNKSGKFNDELETYIEIPSDVIPFEQRPWMKCAEITDKVCDAIEKNEYEFIRLNYPNGDMVGHTGVFDAVLVAMEGMDLQIGRVIEAVKKAGAILIITADHGNSDDMYEHNKKTGDVSLDENGTIKRKTSHSLNPVPCIIFDPEGKGEYKSELNDGLGISSISATCIELLGYNAPKGYDPTILKWN